MLQVTVVYILLGQKSLGEIQLALILSKLKRQASVFLSRCFSFKTFRFSIEMLLDETGTEVFIDFGGVHAFPRKTYFKKFPAPRFPLWFLHMMNNHNWCEKIDA